MNALDQLRADFAAEEPYLARWEAGIQAAFALRPDWAHFHDKRQRQAGPTAASSEYAYYRLKESQLSCWPIAGPQPDDSICLAARADDGTVCPLELRTAIDEAHQQLWVVRGPFLRRYDLVTCQALPVLRVPPGHDNCALGVSRDGATVSFDQSTYRAGEGYFSQTFTYSLTDQTWSLLATGPVMTGAIETVEHDSQGAVCFSTLGRSRR